MATDKHGETNLGGKFALVTGASRGIGRAIAVRLAQLGASVGLAARDEAALRGLASELEAVSPRVSVHVFDISRHESAPALVDQVIHEHGRIDILINNAGGSVQGSLTELDDSAWSDAFELKLLGGMRIARAAWPSLAAAKGSLINIAGAAGWSGEARNILAATQCGGYYAMTKSMAALGLQDGVQVNAINPGPVWTDRLKSRLAALGISEDQPEKQILAAVAAKYGLRAIAQPADIANLVAFVLSPSGNVFHGALINFDGGAAKGL